MRKKCFFYSSFLNFSGFWAKIFSDFWPKNFENLSKLTSTCPEEQFVAWIFFFKFWIVSDFLQKLLACFSKFHLRVQSKNCGRNSFFYFSFQKFFGIWAKKFSDFLPKNFKKLSKLPSACADEQFLAWKFFFLKFWIFLDFLQKASACSQKSIYVSRVKVAEERVFLFFLSEFFRILSEKFFRLLANKLQEFVKTTFYVSRGTICDLNFF